jgi:hypothetical protein
MYSYNPMPLKGNKWAGDPRTVEENTFLSKRFENTPVLSYYNTGIQQYLSQYGAVVLDPQKWNIWSKKYFVKKVEPGKNFKIKETI